MSCVVGYFLCRIKVTATMEGPSSEKIKVPLPQQQEAIQYIVSRYEEGLGGFLLLGGTGAGKTITSLEIAKAITTMPLRTSNTRFVSYSKMHGRRHTNRTMAIIPPLGGTVIKQWQREALATGWGAQSVLYYYGGNQDQRRRLLERWNTHADDHPDTPHIVLTTIDILLSECKLVFDVADRKKITIDDLRIAAFQDVAPKFGKCRCVLLDESHDYGKGSSAFSDDVEVDPTQIKYNVLNEIVRYHKPDFLLGMTATPFVNSWCDVYSFLRLICPGRKELYTYRVGHEKFEGHEEAAMREIERFQAKYVYEIKKMESVVNPTTITDVRHGIDDAERVLMDSATDALKDKATKLMHKISEHAIAPSNETRKARMIAEMLYNKEMTRCRRGLVHPAFYSKPVYSTTDYELDAYGQKTYFFDHKLGKDMPKMQVIRPGIDELYEKWPIEKCSKFSAILNRIDEIVKAENTTRIIVCLHWAEPLRLLAKYAKDRFPQKTIIEHHGLAPRRPWQAMEAFASPFHTGAIMLATTPGIDRGVDLPWTTKGADGNRVAVRMIVGDLPFSAAAEQQLQGRIKRLPAQGYPDQPDRVRNWFVDRVLVGCEKPTIEDFFLKLISQKASKAVAFVQTKEELLEAGLEATDETSPDAPITKPDKPDKAGKEREQGSLMTLLTTLSPDRPSLFTRETRGDKGKAGTSGVMKKTISKARGGGSSSKMKM